MSLNQCLFRGHNGSSWLNGSSGFSRVSFRLVPFVLEVKLSLVNLLDGLNVITSVLRLNCVGSTIRPDGQELGEELRDPTILLEVLLPLLLLLLLCLFPVASYCTAPPCFKSLLLLLLFAATVDIK